MKKNILIVEDELPLVEAIRDRLESRGFTVSVAKSVEEAIAHLENKEQKTDVVWLDHYLIGKETGLDFVAKVKAHEEWKHLPIFVVSNTGSPDKRHVYIKLGATKYFIKAENKLDEIIDEVEKFVD